jgi:predicted nucleotidyltransferase component of viral defense system
MPHSVRQRLLNLARQTGQDYNRLLVRYGLERLLYRLSRSDHANRFILKGAILFAVWSNQQYRATQDLELNGKSPFASARQAGIPDGQP